MGNWLTQVHLEKQPLNTVALVVVVYMKQTIQYNAVITINNQLITMAPCSQHSTAPGNKITVELRGG